jgi:RNA polymerase sigma-70 factor (ECF subfamily)
VAIEDTETESLLNRAECGDASAVEQLISLHRGRLRRMIGVHMDTRLAARIDPSDVIQEAAIEVSRRLPAYLKRRECAFYPWLRRIAWERLAGLHRQHVEARRRSVEREMDCEVPLPDESVVQLADLLQASQTSPSRHMVREELRQRVRAALQALGPLDRGILVLRHLEQLSMKEIAEVLGLTLFGAQSRYRRALERLHEQLGGEPLENF